VPEPIDIYVDAYQVSTNPYAGTINFMLSDALPVAPGSPPKSVHLASIRLSLENMKLLAFFLYRQIKQHEENLGVNIQVPQQVLNAVQIGAEDWQTFWKRHGG
jgi:hypothetical protein